MNELRQRQPRIENKAFLAFVREQPCCACGSRQNVQAAHVRMASPAHGKRETGKGERPSDRFCVPLCAGCHMDDPGAQHKVGERHFWRSNDVDPFAVAAALYAEFENEQANR
jgi:hypothetical protein